MDDMRNEMPFTEAAREPAPRAFSKLESGYAWLCVLLGYLFCRVAPVAAHPLGGFCFVVALFAVTAVVLRCKNASFGAPSLTAAGSALVMSVALLVSADPFLHTLAYAYAAVAYLYFVYAAYGNGASLTAARAWVAWCKALFVPFYALALLPQALFSHRMKNGGKVLGKVLGGAAIAIVPTLIVIGLLSYDDAFTSLLSEMARWDLSDAASHLFSVILGIPVGMMLFGAVTASEEHRGEELLDDETCDKIAASVRIVSAVTVTAAATPLLAVYALFFFSQWPYFVSGFTGELPQGFSFAEYAREGFFQLCAVSVINFAVILLACVCMKRRDSRPPVILRVLTMVYAACTLVLISTAVAKMVMYIDTYGLTRKRVYATWFMLVLAALFVLAAVKMVAPRVKAVTLSGVIVTAAFALLALSNANGWIAAYNVERYLDGTLETVDVEALEDLGDAAVPSLVRLREALGDTKDPKARQLHIATTKALGRYADRTGDTEVFALTIPAVCAERALDEAGIR